MPVESIYETPKSALSDYDNSKLFRRKRYVIFEKEAKWPGRCFKCNEEVSEYKTVKLTYLNPWFYLTLLITPVVTIVLGLIFQKKFTIELPVCDLHLKKRKRYIIFQWALVLSMVLAFVIGSVTKNGAVFFLGLVLLLMVVISAINGRLVHLAKVKDENLWVRGSGKDFVNSLAEFE